MIIAAEVSIVIAIALILYSQEINPTSKSRLDEVHLALKRDEKSKRARKARATGAMCASIECLIYYCSLLAEMGGRYARVPKSKRPQFRDDFEALRNNVAAPASDLERMLDSVECPDDRTRGDILAAIDRLRDALPTDGEVTVDAAQYRAVSRSFGPVLTRLGRHLEPTTERPHRRPGTVGEPGGLALGLKRYTYPPGAPICMTVKAASPFPHRKIAVTILDEGFNELDKKTTDAIEQASKPPSTLDIDMKPRKNLDAGHEYIARVTCSDLYGEAVFVVDRVDPTVHTDRPVCTMGDYIGITAEDPAACAGGAGVEPAAEAAGKPCLTVKSPHGPVECRLEEAEHSPRTFCGRVRCVGVHAGDSDRDAASDAGYNGTGGGEVWADAIPCEPDQLIRIKYESAAEEAWTAVLVDGTDASVAAGSGGLGRPATGEGGGDGKKPPPRGSEEDRDGGTKDGSEGGWGQ